MGKTVPGIGRLVVGTCGSPGSLRALRYGESLARAHNAVLIPVFAWEPPGGDRDERLALSAPLRQACLNLAQQRLRDALIAVWGEVPADSLVQPRVERGPPAGFWSALRAAPMMCWSWVLAATGHWPGWPFPGQAATAWLMPSARSWPSRRPNWRANSPMAAAPGRSGIGP